MSYLEVIARARVRPGQLEGVKAQAAEIVRQAREGATRTLRCDWFISEDGTECEVHESFADEQGLIEYKLHTMEAAGRLFRDHAYDHRSTLYGEVSANFLRLVHEWMGAAPAVFSFLQGLNGSPAGGRPVRTIDSAAGKGQGAKGHLELHAHLKVRPGEPEGFMAQAAEIMRLTRERDAQTVRYDWFISQDGAECEVHEAYLSAQGLIDHNAHVMDARAVLFERYAYDHRMTAFGEVSQELRELADKHAGGIGVYSFLQGLETAAAV